MFPDTDFFCAELDDNAALNDLLWSQFHAVFGTDKVRGTHLFEGRYENLYVDLADVPAVEPVLAAARRLAARRLDRPPGDLAVGFWFNYMQPGQVTLPHSHDDDDELLSGVYYVRVPADAGELVLHLDGERRSIEPQPGRFVFFSPRLVHEVEANRSGDARLSVAMNFGVRR
jgi:hypothetical protein